MIHTVDYIVPVADALPSDLCKELIQKFEKKASGHTIHDEDKQKFSELNLSNDPDFEKECNIIHSASSYLMDFYKKEVGVKYFPTSYRFEEFRMKKYEPDGKQQFDWHADVGDYSSARRFMVCFFYLNTVIEGGNTLFDWSEDENEAAIVNPEEGKAVLFPPFWTHPHKGTKPISGPKYIISTYAHFI